MGKNQTAGVNRFKKSADIVAEAVVKSGVGTVTAFSAAVTDVILPSAMETVEETKKLFPDPNNPGTDSKPYIKSIALAFKSGITAAVGVVTAGVVSVTGAIIPSAVQAATEIKDIYMDDRL